MLIFNKNAVKWGMQGRKKTVQSTNYVCKSNSSCLFLTSSVGGYMEDKEVETGRQEQSECWDHQAMLIY